MGGSSSSTYSTSSLSFPTPREKRTDPEAVSAGTEHAARTCDPLRALEVQAEPLETAIPFWSRKSSMLSPSMNSTTKLAFQGSHVPRVDRAGLVYPDLGDLEVELLERARRVQHGEMLNSRHDQVIAPATRGQAESLDRGVVGFGAAGCEDDFFGGGADQAGDTQARFLDRDPRPVAARME